MGAVAWGLWKNWESFKAYLEGPDFPKAPPEESA